MIKKFIKLGSKVTLKSRDGDLITYVLVNGEEKYLLEGELSISSSLGKSLENMTDGISILVDRNKGISEKYYILKVY